MYQLVLGLFQNLLLNANHERGACDWVYREVEAHTEKMQDIGFVLKIDRMLHA